MRNLPIEWTKHLKGDDKENFEQLVRNSTRVLGRLQDILTNYITSIEAEETTPKQFQEPSWSYHAAYRMGQRAAVKDLLRLLDFMDT